jgi:hypothetical protein
MTMGGRSGVVWGVLYLNGIGALQGVEASGSAKASLVWEEFAIRCGFIVSWNWDFSFQCFLFLERGWWTCMMHQSSAVGHRIYHIHLMEISYGE